MMQRKLLFLITFFLLSNFSFSQTEYSNDSTSYEKTIDYVKKREFNDDLPEKYSGKDFEYKEEVEVIKEVMPVQNSGLMKDIALFFAEISPYLLGVVLVFIILKSFINTESGFWNFGKAKNKKVAKKLIFEDEEDLENSDFEHLLKQAISNDDYRLATRYYYLILLKKLTLKNYVKYHKDKTNSEYLSELKDKQIKTEFSYTSYIYNYVWYGEFIINKHKFNIIETKYKSLINKVI